MHAITNIPSYPQAAADAAESILRGFHERMVDGDTLDFNGALEWRSITVDVHAEAQMVNGVLRGMMWVHSDGDVIAASDLHEGRMALALEEAIRIKKG